jgi:hypothetical protein
MWESISSLFAIILVITVLNCILLGLVAAILHTVPGRPARLLLPALVMVGGYLVLMKADPANLLLGTCIFVLPMAVLLAFSLISGLADPVTDFTRVLLGDFFCSIITVMVLGFIISSRYLNTVQYYENMALSNGITYACVFVFDIMLAILLFTLMRRKRNRYPVRAKKEE